MACEILVGWRGHHPEQITDAMLEVALEACSRWGPATIPVARAAVEAGCIDGMAWRRGCKKMTDTSVTPLRGLAGIPDVAGDHLNAQRFLITYGNKVRRSPELGRWYIWNGAWWDEDRLDRVPDMAADAIDQLREWVAEADNADEFKRRTHHYTASAKAGRRDALLSIAGTDPDVVVAVDQLDAHPMLLACRNGTVDCAARARYSRHGLVTCSPVGPTSITTLKRPHCRGRSSSLRRSAGIAT